jgi:hypothetical protein
MTTPHVLNELSHAELNSFLHNIDQSSEKEVTRDTNGLVSKVTVWAPGKTQKLRETTLHRTAGLVDSAVKVQYDGAGNALETLTLTFTRDDNHIVTAVTTTRS